MNRAVALSQIIDEYQSAWQGIRRIAGQPFALGAARGLKWGLKWLAPEGLCGYICDATVIGGLETAMTCRAENAAVEIEMRLRNAVKELPRWREYRYLVINDRLEEAYTELKGIVLAEHCRNVDIETSL